MIRVVLMDVGNVLVKFDMERMLAAFLPGTGKSRREVLAYLIESGIGVRYEKGLISSQEFFESAGLALGFKGDFASFKASWNDAFDHNPEGLAAFRSLKKRVPVFLASNTNALHFEYLRARFAFLAEADGEILSHEIHARKPEPEFFLKAIERAGVRPEEALLIDDLAANVAGARKIGAAAALYSGAAALARDVAAHGLEII